MNGGNPLGGILSSILGQSPAAQHARLEEASRSAKDLTNLVKKKRTQTDPDVTPAGTSLLRTSGKRKVEFDEEVVEVETGKKARLSDGEDDGEASVSHGS